MLNLDSKMLNKIEHLDAKNSDWRMIVACE